MTPDRELPAEAEVPESVGLCPFHPAEFYVPNVTDGDPCPEGWCDGTLEAYVPEAEAVRLRERVDELERALGDIRGMMAGLGPDEVLDQDRPAEMGRRWVISHEKGLCIVAVYNRARSALGDLQGDGG